MPRVNDAETVWARRASFFWTVISLVIIVACFIALSYLGSVSTANNQTTSLDGSACFEPYPSLTRGRSSYLNSTTPLRCRLYLERARTEEARAKGLSGRQSLGYTEGMLFEFDESGIHCMWMKDMHIPIDMIWLNEEKRIVKIEENVEPSTYPKSFCNEDLPAKYVIETNTKVSGALGLKVGQQVTF